MNKSEEAIKIYNAINSALTLWEIKQKERGIYIDPTDQPDLGRTIIAHWDKFPMAKKPFEYSKNIYNAIYEVLTLKSNLFPKEKHIPQGKEITWIARMTLKNYWGNDANF